MNTILHPTDFTADSEQAFLLACSIARDQSAELIVLHVIRPDCVAATDRDGDELNRDSVLFQSCWSRFERLHVQATGASVALQVKVGQPVETIARVVRDENCGLIVLAAHHYTFLHYQFHGSVSESLGHQTLVPILCFQQSPFHQESPAILDGLERKLQPGAIQAATVHSAMEGDPHERLDSPDLMCDRL